ncbi:MAG: BrnT family toxin [Phycisphaerae bacterium]
MDNTVAGFDWDAGNRAKCQKHGVSITEIEAIFDHEPHVAPDPDHSDVEDRLIAIGRNSRGRPMFVAFTIRQRGTLRLIRPVSARYMHQKEIKHYEA